MAKKNNVVQEKNFSLNGRKVRLSVHEDGTVDLGVVGGRWGRIQPRTAKAAEEAGFFGDLDDVIEMAAFGHRVTLAYPGYREIADVLAAAAIRAGATAKEVCGAVWRRSPTEFSQRLRTLALPAEARELAVKNGITDLPDETVRIAALLRQGLDVSVYVEKAQAVVAAKEAVKKAEGDLSWAEYGCSLPGGSTCEYGGCGCEQCFYGIPDDRVAEAVAGCREDLAARKSELEEAEASLDNGLEKTELALEIAEQ